MSPLIPIESSGRGVPAAAASLSRISLRLAKVRRAASAPPARGAIAMRPSTRKAVDAEVFQGERGLEEPLRVTGFDAGLRRIEARVDLQEDRLGLAEGARLAVQDLEKLRTVHALDPVEMAHGELRLVGLEVPDQLPRDSRRGLSALVDALLHPVLADRAQAEAGCKLHRLGRLGLRDREQFHVGGAAAGAGARLGDPGADALCSAGEFLVVRQHVDC
jgi:hypothetical protein